MSVFTLSAGVSVRTWGVCCRSEVIWGSVGQVFGKLSHETSQTLGKMALGHHKDLRVSYWTENVTYANVKC